MIKQVLPTGKKKMFLQGESMKRGFRLRMPSGLQEKRVVIGACLAGIALLWVIFAPRMGVYSLLRQRSTVNRLRLENVELEQKNAFLQKEIERIQNDPDYFEKMARDKYGLLRENEMVFEFPPSKKDKKE